MRISSKPSTLSRRARSTLSSLPRSGRIAWWTWSRPPLALPPALSPSTMNISVRATSLEEQSASLCGMPPESRAPLRLMSSRALRAASRASAARRARLQMLRASEGCSSSHAPSSSFSAPLTKGVTSGLRSFSFVWLLNVGFFSLTLTMAARPSRRSSPVTWSLPSLKIPLRRA